MQSKDEQRTEDSGKKRRISNCSFNNRLVCCSMHKRRGGVAHMRYTDFGLFKIVNLLLLTIVDNSFCAEGRLFISITNVFGNLSIFGNGIVCY